MSEKQDLKQDLELNNLNEKKPETVENVIDNADNLVPVQSENISKTWKQLLLENYKPGLQVAMVNIPLSLSLAIASGGRPLQGLATAIFSPMLQGPLGSSKHMILGPAGALVNTLNVVSVVAGPACLPFIALFNGIFSLIIFSFKLEKYSVYMPECVLQGFLFGIGVVISFSQLPFIFGLTGLKKFPHFYENFYEAMSALGQTKISHVLLFLFSFIPLFFLSKHYPKIPWIFIICMLGLIFGAITSSVDPDREWSPMILGDLYPEMNESVNIFNLDHWSVWDQMPQSEIINAGISAMIISVLETIITARIVQQKTKVDFRCDQEIVCMSIANIICGIFGALPCNGVIVRSNVNADNFATSTLSAFINGSVTCIITLAFLNLFAYIPTPCIAAVLCTAAVRMCPFSAMGYYYRKDKENLFVLLLVLAVCIFIDGAVGLVVGIVICLLRNADKIAHDYVILSYYNRNNKQTNEFRISPRTQPDMREDLLKKCFAAKETTIKDQSSEVGGNDTLVVGITGQLSYVNCENSKSLYIHIIDKFQRSLIFSFKHLQFVDIDGMKFFYEVLKYMDAKQLKYLIVEPFELECQKKFQSMEWYQKLQKDNVIVKSQQEALDSFVKI